MKKNMGSMGALIRAVAGAVLTVSSTSAVFALGSNYLQISDGVQQSGLWFESGQSTFQDGITAFNDSEQQLVRSTFFLNQHFSNYTLHLGMAKAPQQQLSQFGLSLGSATVYGFSGEGDTTSDIFHSYNAVNDFHFHGGLRHDYTFSGYQFGYRLTPKNTVAITQAVVEADGLYDRTVDELSWQGRWIDMSFANVNTGGEHSGTALGVAARIGNYQLGLQQMKAANDARFTRLNLTSQTRGNKIIELALERRTNPLFEAANENRLLVTLGFRFGGAPALYANEAEETPEEEAPKRSKTGPILVGAGAVGAAIALSSGGGGGGDSRPRFSSQNASAKEVLNRINPKSVAENREYGGYVFRNADGSFSSTNPIQGETASVSLPDPRTAAPSQAVTTASYHTHAATDPRYVNEEFSPQDIFSDVIFRIDGYLATPQGRFRFHNYRTGAIVSLGGPGSLATRP